MITVKKNEATAAYRRMFFQIVDSVDGITPETGEAGGQPEVSVNGDVFGTQAIIGVLVAIGNGRYYAELTQAGVNIADRSVIEGRYKSANTAEAVGTTVQIVEYPVDASVSAVKTETAIIAVDVAGLDGAVMRGTDDAALASVCTEARLSELDAATGGKMANEVDIIKTETQSHPTLAEIEASTVIAKEATLVTIAGYIDTEVTAILNRIGAFTGTGWNTVLGFFRALMRKDVAVTLPTDIGGTFDNITDSLEAIRDRGDEGWTGQMSGANAITITVYKQATSTPVPDYHISVYNSGETNLLAVIMTDANGQATINLDNGTYKLRGRKAGYVPVNTVETLIVDGVEAMTIYATEISIGSPDDVNACRVYEWCFMPDDVTPMSSVTATAKILSLPYSYDGKLHSGVEIDGTYDSVSGKVYWDLVHGAKIKFKIEDVLPEITKVVPSVASIRVSEMI